MMRNKQRKQWMKAHRREAKRKLRERKMTTMVSVYRGGIVEFIGAPPTFEPDGGFLTDEIIRVVSIDREDFNADGQLIGGAITVARNR